MNLVSEKTSIWLKSYELVNYLSFESFYCSWVIHKVMPTTASEQCLPSALEKAHYFRNASSNYKASIYLASQIC